MTYLGALLTVLAALSLGIFKVKEEIRKVKTLRELCSFLEMLKNEICTNKIKLNKFFQSDSIKTFQCLSEFLRKLQNGMSELGERRFCNIWSAAVDETLSILPDKSSAAFRSLGNTLGKYDADMQKSAIERCMRVVQAEYEELENTRLNNEKMYIGLSGGVGLIIALVLI